ncbi:hypothetical protein L218DRAFT_1005640, partial [Marasmius fiardii PR-910]
MATPDEEGATQNLMLLDTPSWQPTSLTPGDALTILAAKTALNKANWSIPTKSPADSTALLTRIEKLASENSTAVGAKEDAKTRMETVLEEFEQRIAERLEERLEKKMMELTEEMTTKLNGACQTMGETLTTLQDTAKATETKLRVQTPTSTMDEAMMGPSQNELSDPAQDTPSYAKATRNLVRHSNTATLEKSNLIARRRHAAAIAEEDLNTWKIFVRSPTVKDLSEKEITQKGNLAIAGMGKEAEGK